ncbi:uncharacterized protein LOC143066857 [Mytilus galloprovincialis]|uniref:uncharacterized protein LOC143066857 n=1 Tax=Mytilus galloprovincialis TaxID=29158 RepID=UPI003F7BBBB5
MAEENIINAMKDTSSFKGIDGGMETSVGISHQDTCNSRHSQDSITSDQMFTVEPISPVPAQNGFPTCQTVDVCFKFNQNLYVKQLSTCRFTIFCGEYLDKETGAGSPEK